MITKMDTKPHRKFIEQKKNNPDLTDTILLNSNNQSHFTGKADVVVAGAGIIGLLYAIHLKHLSPDLKIAIFEKSSAPMQKIGESTLSSFTRLVVGEIVPQEYLLRLFGLKDGLQFYCIDEEGLKVTSGDVGGLDISFQLDRRMSELFFTMWAQRMGINVYHGVDVAFDITAEEEDHSGVLNSLYKWLPLSRSTTPLPGRPTVTPPRSSTPTPPNTQVSTLPLKPLNYLLNVESTLPFQTSASLAADTASTIYNWLPVSRSPSPNREKPFRTPQVSITSISPHLTNGPIDTKLVIDATGFARKLTSKFGRKETFPGWNCDAYWSYFKEKPNSAGIDPKLEHWDYPATKHVCFPEGWGWFIKLISWHHVPLANLMDLVDYIIDSAMAGVPVDEVPCTNELSQMFDAPWEFITSIGWAVRNDTKFPDNIKEYGATEGERKFKYFQKKYPVLDGLMEGNYEVLPKYYGERTYFVRKTMAFQSPVVAGPGWFAIGNSAGFTNPLISPGINAGAGTAFLAAELSSTILSSLNSSPSHSTSLMSSSITRYQTYHHDWMMPRLHQMNRYWYNMFRNQTVFGVLVTCYWALGVDDINAQYGDRFTDNDLLWLVGAGGDAFQTFASKILSLLSPNAAQSNQPVPEEMVDRVTEMAREKLRERHELFPGNKWGRYLRGYGDDLIKRVDGEGNEKRERDSGAKFKARRCEGCRYWVFDYATMCPVCGVRTGEEERVVPVSTGLAVCGSEEVCEKASMCQDLPACQSLANNSLSSHGAIAVV